jgi:hypothetical protein
LKLICVGRGIIEMRPRLLQISLGALRNRDECV